MSLLNSVAPSHGTRSLAAFFPSRQAAEDAKAEVIATGVSTEAVKITDGTGTVTGRSAATEREGTGPVDTVKHALAQDAVADAATAGFVATAHVAADRFGAVRDILARGGQLHDV